MVDEMFYIHVFRDYEPWYLVPMRWVTGRRMLRHKCFKMGKYIGPDTDIVKQMNLLRKTIKDSGWEVEIWRGEYDG